MIKKIFISVVIILVVMLGIITASVKMIDYKNIHQSFAQSAKIDAPSIEKSKFTIKIFPLIYFYIIK